MASNLVKRDSAKDLNLPPGYFTGNYTAANNRISDLPQTQKLSSAALSFTNELQKLMKQSPMALKAALQPAKVQNLPNCLPLTAAVTQRIGAEGAILALSAALRYCQYYKKNSPAPKFM
jgi:hypothetical protein